MKPKLRFSEFSDDWKIKSIFEANIEVIDGDRGNNYPNGEELSDSGYCLFLSAKNVTKSGFCFDDRVFISQEKDQKLRNGKLNKFDIVLTTRGTVGNVAYYDEQIKYDDIRINSGMVILRSNKSDFLPKYLYKTTGSKMFIDQVNTIAFGSAQPQLTVSGINKIKLSMTSKPEQQKIADFLTAVDDKISAIDKKVELLKQYKKGAMQKIFRQEIRFRDENGNFYPEWNKTNLGSLCNITTGKLDANAMVAGGRYRFYTCAKEYYQIDDFVFDTEALLISGNGANVGYIHYYNGKFNAYQRTYVLDKFIDNIQYIKYFLDANLSDRINTEKKEGNTPYIVLNTLSDMNIIIPRDHDEQCEIADFLTSIDDKINLTEQKLNSAKQFKKALLQKMFV